MTSPSIRCLRVTTIARAALMVLICACPTLVSAQAGDPVSIEAVEIWIHGKVKPERAWNRDISKAGISFPITPDTEARLRRVGANDEWMAVLQRATYIPPPRMVANEGKPSFSKRDLRPLYFGNEARIAPYFGMMQLEEKGGSVSGHVMQTTRGSVLLKSPALASGIPTMGIVVDYRGVGLDIEGAFQDDLMILNLGFKYSPFLPLGTSGIRVLAGVKPFLGVARQTLAHLPRESSDTTDPVVDLLNSTYGADASAGLAYHWRPGAWVFAEVNYRMTSTFARELRAPDQEAITEGIPWSKWSARGLMFKFGVGF